MLSMLATDIQSKNPHRQALAESVAIYLACGGEIVTPQPVIKTKKQWGGTFHPTQDTNLKNQALTDSIRRLVAEGRGVMTICEHLKVTPRTAHSLAAKAGFSIPKKTTGSEARKKYNDERHARRDENLQEVVRMRSTGMLHSEIGKALGVSKATICRWLDHANGK